MRVNIFCYLRIYCLGGVCEFKCTCMYSFTDLFSYWTSIAYIPKTLVCLYLILMFIGYSSKLRWMFHKLYASGDYTVCKYYMLHIQFGK